MSRKSKRRMIGIVIAVAMGVGIYGCGSTATTVPPTSNPIPATTTISPTSVAAGGAAFTLTVNGTNFVAGAVVHFAGVARTTTFVSAAQLTAAIPAAAITTAGIAAVTVTNPAPGGGTSNTANFTITATPIPATTTISPNSSVPGGAAFTLTVNGSNFVTGSVVRWNGSDRPTAFISASQVSAQIPASDIAVAGTAAITVFNPAPGGGASNSLTFTITGPTITTISPTSAATGGAAFTLTVNGSNFEAAFGFEAGSVVNFAGVARTTTFVSAAQLTAAIPAAAITTAGIAAVTVTNPDSGGGPSNTVNFTIGLFLPRFAYVANEGLFSDLSPTPGNVSMYTINATTGALTALAPGTIAAGLRSRAVAADASGRFTYVANEDSGNVSMYTINAASGALTALEPGTIAADAAAAGPTSVAVDPSGRFAYVANGGDGLAGFFGSVSMYTINATTGALSSIGTVAAGLFPNSVAVDPSGRFAYVANGDLVRGTGSVSMYTINATTGALSSIGTIVTAGAGASSVAVDPSGKFAYVTHEFSDNVSMFTINAATGALTSIGMIATGITPGSVAVDPSGKFAYVANGGSNDVSMFTINAATGALTSIGTIAAGSNPRSVAVDASGKFAYVANGGSNDVSMYTINVTTGALTSIGTIAAGINPRSVAIVGIIQ